MKKFRVIKTRKTDTDNPIVVFKGMQVTCLQESSDNEWAGWIFCESEDNKGWVPKQFIDRRYNIGVILEDYNANEFDIYEDEIIVMEKILNGWIWGFKENNPTIKGWAPINHLEEL